MDYESIIRSYFNAWLFKDETVLSAVFSENVVYSECYGPEYRGLAQIQRWFDEWNHKGTVLQWDIKNMLAQANLLCVEWYFRCVYDGVEDGFDGVSLVEFDLQGKIGAIREFQSKAEHVFPYGMSE